MGMAAEFQVLTGETRAKALRHRESRSSTRDSNKSSRRSNILGAVNDILGSEGGALYGPDHLKRSSSTPSMNTLGGGRNDSLHNPLSPPKLPRSAPSTPLSAGNRRRFQRRGSCTIYNLVNDNSNHSPTKNNSPQKSLCSPSRSSPRTRVVVSSPNNKEVMRSPPLSSPQPPTIDDRPIPLRNSSHHNVANGGGASTHRRRLHDLKLSMLEKKDIETSDHSTGSFYLSDFSDHSTRSAHTIDDLPLPRREISTFESPSKQQRRPISMRPNIHHSAPTTKPKTTRGSSSSGSKRQTNWMPPRSPGSLTNSNHSLQKRSPGSLGSRGKLRQSPRNSSGSIRRTSQRRDEILNGIDLVLAATSTSADVDAVPAPPLLFDDDDEAPVPVPRTVDRSTSQGDASPGWTTNPPPTKKLKSRSSKKPASRGSCGPRRNSKSSSSSSSRQKSNLPLGHGSERSKRSATASSSSKDSDNGRGRSRNSRWSLRTNSRPKSQSSSSSSSSRQSKSVATEIKIPSSAPSSAEVDENLEASMSLEEVFGSKW